MVSQHEYLVFLHANWQQTFHVSFSSLYSFQKSSLCVDTRYSKMAVKNGSEDVWGDFGMNLEKYKAGFVIYLQLPLGWRQQWSR